MNVSDKIPAFPTSNTSEPYSGMTLRDYLAAKAMAAILASDNPLTACGETAEETGIHLSKCVAAMAYLYADEMMKARNK